MDLRLLVRHFKTTAFLSLKKKHQYDMTDGPYRIILTLKNQYVIDTSSMKGPQKSRFALSFLKLFKHCVSPSFNERKTAENCIHCARTLSRLEIDVVHNF